MEPVAPVFPSGAALVAIGPDGGGWVRAAGSTGKSPVESGPGGRRARLTCGGERAPAAQRLCEEERETDFAAVGACQLRRSQGQQSRGSLEWSGFGDDGSVPYVDPGRLAVEFDRALRREPRAALVQKR